MPAWLSRLLAPPVFPDEDKMRVAQILNNFLWAAISILSITIVVRIILWRENGFAPLLILLGVVVLLIGAQIIVHRGYVRGAGQFLVSALWLAMTFQAWEADGVRDVAAIAYLIIILLAGLLLGWREGVFVGTISLAALWFFAFQEIQGIRVQHMDTPFNIARDLSIIFILAGVLIYFLINSLNRSLYNARLELKERLRADEKLRKQTNYLAALNETALDLLNRPKLNPLLETILTRACDLLNTEHGVIELLLSDESALQQVVGHGVLSKYNGHFTVMNEGVAGSVWASGQPLVVQDYKNWGGNLPEFAEAGFNAVIGVPLKVDKKVIGVIAISYVEQDRIFTQDQVSLMEQFASLAALAIDNARLYERTQIEIRERIEIETELRASEERFRKVFHASPVAIVITSLDEGRMIDANDSYWKLTAFDPQKSLGKTSVELGVWVNMDERNRFIERLKNEHSIYNPNYQFINERGESVPTIAFYELVQLDGADTVLSMFYDISDQKHAQESLKTSEARTRAILTSIPDMIFEISKNGTFLDFMPSAEMTSVMPPSQFIGKNIREMFPPVIADQTFFALERALATGQLHAFEYGLPPGEEVQFFEARVSSITSESAIIMVRDISQQKYIQTEREKLINELEDKNSELERFTYTVSHDLKSPLITIKGFLGFLEEDAITGNTMRLKTDIKRIGDATNKMQILLNELLELSRVGRVTNPYQDINIKELSYEVVESLQGRLTEKNVTVNVQENLPLVYGDRRRLTELFQNLIDNAAKFTGTQLNPQIEIGHHGFESEKPVFYVKDNGMGIEVIHQDRIFGLFNKLDATSDGTGIGLALVKRIVEVHGGRIWVESEEGNGATFFFTLPTGPES